MNASHDLAPSRRRTMGLAIGSLWLVAISAVFGAVSLVAIGTPTAGAALAAAVALVVTIAAFGVVVVRTATRMPPDSARDAERGIGRRFVWIVAAEILAFAVANSWAVSTGRFALIPSLDLTIVGLHFFPLASLFRVPRYHVMALFFCAIPVATLTLFPEASVIGHVQTWYVLPSLGCGLVATITGAAGLKEATRAATR